MLAALIRHPGRRCWFQLNPGCHAAHLRTTPRLYPDQNLVPVLAVRTHEWRAGWSASRQADWSTYGLWVAEQELIEFGSVGWTATAIIALRSGQYVRDKAACVELYEKHVADEWTD